MPGRSYFAGRFIEPPAETLELGAVPDDEQFVAPLKAFVPIRAQYLRTAATNSGDLGAGQHSRPRLPKRNARPRATFGHHDSFDNEIGYSHPAFPLLSLEFGTSAAY